MDYLISKGYQVIRLDEMVRMMGNNSLPSKPVVLTFDDAYYDFYTNVFPVLKEKNIKATLFVISQFTGGDRYVNWGMIKEMSDSGLVLIGDHTLNHPSLPKMTLEEERNQIISAKVIIEDHIGKMVNFFAYPYGGVNANAKQILKDSGFIGAVVTTNYAPQCLGLPYEFSRIRVSASALSRFGL
jgi:peptidoglycan/xylan/chitin deacetylase (PgdA/CDA1 family)